MSKWKIISKNLNWFIGCSTRWFSKKQKRTYLLDHVKTSLKKNANSSYLNVWTSVRFLKAPIYSKGWWKIVGETLNNNALSSQWINQYTLFFKMPLTTTSECMGKTFQAAMTNTWEIFGHISLLQNIFLISAKLNFHGPLVCISNQFFSSHNTDTRH